jgi:hypothetical protein
VHCLMTVSKATKEDAAKASKPCGLGLAKKGGCPTWITHSHRPRLAPPLCG